jgi:hypothetical protein
MVLKLHNCHSRKFGVCFVLSPISAFLNTTESVRNLQPRYTRCGYEIPGMSLLRYLYGTTRLDRSKNMSVQVLTCAI